MAERREALRAPIRVPVEHIVSEREKTACETEDLSLTGLRLSRLEGESWGQCRWVWLQLGLPSEAGGPLRALAEVRHLRAEEGSASEDASRGFWIKYINPRDRRRYERFVHGALAVA